MISYLSDIFTGKAYKFVEINSQALAESRAEETLRCYETIVGSEDFQVALFTPGSEIFKSSPRLCICNLCVLNYGSSKEYKVFVKQLKSTSFRLQMLKTLDQNDDTQKNNNDFVVPGTVCAKAASPNFSDTVWFVRIQELCIPETSSEDDYGHNIVADQSYIIGNFPERSRSNSNRHYFKVGNKTSNFYHESIMYPFGQFKEKKNEFFIENLEYFEIIQFVDHTGIL